MIAIIPVIAEKEKKNFSDCSDHMKLLSSDRSDNNRWDIKSSISAIVVAAIVEIIWKPGSIYSNNHPPFLLNCYLYALQTYRKHSSKLRLLLVYNYTLDNSNKVLAHKKSETKQKTKRQQKKHTVYWRPKHFPLTCLFLSLNKRRLTLFVTNLTWKSITSQNRTVKHMLYLDCFITLRFDSWPRSIFQFSPNSSTIKCD